MWTIILKTSLINRDKELNPFEGSKYMSFQILPYYEHNTIVECHGTITTP